MSVLPLILALLLPAPAAAVERGYSGDWTTTYGDMTLAESSGAVSGTYVMEGQICSLAGRRSGDELVFKYKEPAASGEGRFRLARDAGSFSGEWRADGTTRFIPWLGKRRVPAEPGAAFNGLWDTSFGRMRLTGDAGGIAGYYAFADGTLSGRVTGGVFKFRYKDQKEGEGEFRLAQNGRALSGRWRADGEKEWKEWNALRADPVPGRKWLVVLESRWESSLAEPEYTFGEMLKSFFTRTPWVQVRQRFYTDRESLLRWTREASLLAEPVVLYFSGHGSPEGLDTQSGPATAEQLAAPLRAGGNIVLVHFGSCDVMKAGVAAELQRLSRPARFPVSGFAQPVDWAASAVSDFMYLDLILSRDLTPEKAAAELKRLMPFAGRASADTAYDGLSFRLLPAAEAR